MGPSYTALSCVQAHNHHSALVQQWSQALGMGGEMSLSCLRLSLAHGAHSQCGLSNGDVGGKRPRAGWHQWAGVQLCGHRTIHNKFTLHATMQTTVQSLLWFNLNNIIISESTVCKVHYSWHLQGSHGWVLQPLSFCDHSAAEFLFTCSAFRLWFTDDLWSNLEPILLADGCQTCRRWNKCKRW